MTEASFWAESQRQRGKPVPKPLVIPDSAGEEREKALAGDSGHDPLVAGPGTTTVSQTIGFGLGDQMA